MTLTASGGVVESGALPVAALVAAAGGLVSFLSPCVLPLVPGFLGYVTGLSDADLADRRRWRLVVGALLFVAGFTAVVVPVVIFFTGLSGLVTANRAAFMRGAGVVVLALAVVFAGWGGQRQAKTSWRPAAGLAGAPLLGAAFALGWTPCIGPILATVMLMARPLDASALDVTRPLVLALAYCAGLGVPFVLLAAAWSRAVGAFTWLRGHVRPIQLTGAGLLAVVGLLMVAGVWDAALAHLQTRLAGVTPIL